MPPLQRFEVSAKRGQNVIFKELDAYIQNLVLDSGRERKRRWRRDFSSEAAYIRSVAPNRRRLIQHLGGFPSDPPRLKVVRRPLFENAQCKAFRVSVEALPGVNARGILLLPTGKAQQRPAVIVQHGMGGSPEHAIGLVDPDGIYHGYGRRLCERGYVVFSHSVVNDLTARSRLHRKAAVIGKTILGLEIWKIVRVIDYLQSLPDVRPDRIGMYGISQGGLSTLYAGACDERLAACVVSAYFNLRAPKLVVPGEGRYTALIDTLGTDKFIWGTMLEFSDCDLGSLICPRPLMIETGRLDSEVYWEMVLEEYEKTAEIYSRLGVPNRLALDLHKGGHEIHGRASFSFLDRHLKRASRT